MISRQQLESLCDGRRTPFYLYDLGLLDDTLRAVVDAAAVNKKFRVHYALKACYEPAVVETIRKSGLGLDTVSGGEIQMGLEAGFDAHKILFAGVGKADWEIDLALEAGIGAFNVESREELEVIAERAHALGKTARVALRINPDIDAHTHEYITTGLSENKFGINRNRLIETAGRAVALENIEFVGLHFHIGSQITVTEPFELLCERVNAMVDELNEVGIRVRTLNLGGGLPIDYDTPETNPITDFRAYFDAVNRRLDTSKVEEVHFELGRSIVGNCGQLITRVLYVKEGDTSAFVIVDAGMSELLRPALYGARHQIVNISGKLRGDSLRRVDVVGPICESADVFGKDYELPSPRRGDVMAILSAGAYGMTMSSGYNARHANPAVCL